MTEVAMNYPVWELPAPGLLIAAVAIVHVFISHFAVGGGLFLVLAETKARREGDEALLGFVRALSRGFILLTLVLGALTGVGIWFTIALVQPQATSALVTTFVWAWAIEWTFFATEIAAAMVYYYGWDRLDARTHLAVGWIYFASAWASLVVIAGILAFMLTSGRLAEDAELRRRLLQPHATCRWWRCAPRSRSAWPASTSLFAASFLKDADLKARVARWSATRWIAPAAVARPARAAVVPVGRGRRRRRGGRDARRAVGLARRRPGRRLRHGDRRAPDRARGRARGAGWATALLVVASLALVALRARRYGRLEAGAPHGPRPRVDGRQRVGARGAAQAVGDRPPHVRERRARAAGPGAAPAEDPFALDALDGRGVLATSPWAAAPAAYRPGDPAFERLPVAERAALEAEAGREVFRLECAACHTERGHLGVRRLVQGKSVAAITAVLDATARPVDGGRAAGLVVRPGRARRHLARPPHAALRGDGAPRSAPSPIHLARLGRRRARRARRRRPRRRGSRGLRASTARPATGRRRPGRSRTGCAAARRASFYELIGRLPQVREEMPPFAGSEDERRALAQHLAGLAATVPGDARRSPTTRRRRRSHDPGHPARRPAAPAGAARAPRGRSCS